MEGNCSPGTAVAAEQQVAEADQRRQEPVPGKLAAGHIPGTAEVAGVQSADCSLLKRQNVHILFFLLVTNFQRISLTVMDKKMRNLTNLILSIYATSRVAESIFQDHIVSKKHFLDNFVNPLKLKPLYILLLLQLLLHCIIPESKFLF